MNDLSLTGIDVGSPRLKGSTKQSADRIEVVAGGADIWERRDEFHFAYTQVEGDFVLSARLDSMEMGDVYTKAGLMIRTTLEAGAPHAYLLAFGDNQPRNKNNGGIEFQSRLVTGGPCSGIYPPQPLPTEPDFPVRFPNVWLRLTRAGNTLTGQTSVDGQVWRTFCVHQQPFPDTVYVGLAVTSHNVDKTVECVFSHLELRADSI